MDAAITPEVPLLRTNITSSIACLGALLSPLGHARDEALFNGKDLTGWHFVIDTTGNSADGHVKVDDIFQVRDGVIRAVGNSIFG